ncbi:carboxypeptidase-like regulatory domain-containing protein [Flavobacterium sp.]|uniref:carboxypeptidase-like regulatory domain-containing protein n=1 Tax=Flavobacterium sp. TaxID=239 RepID=UPI00262ED7CD|nr:carboxypeptidase-like regulatory domain-containing protein [Flavobacterium sp.]
MKNLVPFLVLLLSISAFSQNVRFEGIVKDTTNAPLEMANVMAVNQLTKAVDAYSITNDKGKFLLNLKANSTYNVRFTFLGLKTQNLSIDTKTEDISKTIVLSSDATELAGVEIVREMPVSIKGDTIIYNADSFKNGTERKLEDVLKKLPGVQVNADGEIQVEGKKVSKLMVEGKDFFDGDTKLGVKNIPADAIDKVQVLRNYNEVTSLKGLENNEENIAMNIKLKSGKKNFWFGDMTAGIGVGHEEDRHIINPKAFYYSPKYSINVIGNFNNIGELPLTMQDYFKFTGGFKNLMKKGGTNFNVSSNDLGIMGLRNNKAKEINTKFGATNFSYSPSKAFTISGFGIFSSNETDIQTNTRTVGLPDQGSEIRQDISTQKTNLGLFKLSTSYVPSDKVHFDYDGLLKLSDQNEKASVFSQLTNNNVNSVQNIFTNKKQKPLSFNQNLNYYYTLNDKNVFAFEMQHLYQEEDPFYNANLGSNPFPILNLAPQNRFDITQNRFVKTNKLDAKIDYYYMLTPKSNINLTVGNTNSFQNFNSHIFQILDNGSQNDLNDADKNNQVSYAFNDVFLGLHYKFIAGKFTFNPGFSVHNYSMNNEQLGTNLKNNFNRILPDMYALWQLKKAESLTYNFSLANNFTDINKLAQGYVFSNYNSLFKGNRMLENSLSQVHSLRFFKYNMFNFENIFANLTYTKQLDAVKNKAVLAGINQVSSAVNINSNLADETFSGSGTYGRSFLRYYKAQLSANVNWSKFNNILVQPTSEKIQTTKSFTQNYNVNFSTNFKQMPNLNVAYTYTINDNFSDKFFTDAPSVTLEYYFLNAFSFTSEYTFYHNRNSSKSVDNEYDFLSANLMYQKKDSKFEWKLSATNLLNTTSLNDNSFNQVGGSSSFSSYLIQPRYLILSLKYDL